MDQKMISIDTGMFVKSLEPDFCGDAAVIKKYENRTRCFLFDALGHGREAWKSAELCISLVNDSNIIDFVALAKLIHNGIKAKRVRGVVAGFCEIDHSAQKMEYLAMGDISIRIFGPNRTTLVSFPGIIGEVYRTPFVRKTDVFPGDIIVLNSDGIRNSVAENEIQKFLSGSAEETARQIVTNFRRETDDASCIVLKVNK